MVNRLFLGGVALLLMGGVLLWFRGYQPWNPASLQAARGVNEGVTLDSAKQVLQNLDSQLGKTIRSAAEEGVQFPQTGQNTLDSFKQATLSAQVTTTPEELWQTFREQGSQAVLQSVAKQAEVSVNGVSTQAVNEARYQYCLGVVEAYENRE